MANKNQGFTLLQLAVVLVIIGLIAGSIVVGGDMIRATRIQRIVTDVDGYLRAMQLFKEKYHELPGDLSNAESFWGSDAGCPNTPTTNAPHQQTCNGDGNGHIDSATPEYLRAWQQLSSAGLLPGQFTGVIGPGATPLVLGVNIPVSAVDVAGYSVYYDTQYLGHETNVYDWGTPNGYGNVIVFGTVVPGSATTGPAITPGEAFLIDTKMDDGLPASGHVMTNKSNWLPNCTTSDTASISQYRATYKENACNLIFQTGL